MQPVPALSEAEGSASEALAPRAVEVPALSAVKVPVLSMVEAWPILSPAMGPNPAGTPG